MSLFGALIAYIRSRLDDPVVESAIGLVAPFVIYFVAEEMHGSGVIAVVVAALILGQRSTRPATRRGCRISRCGRPFSWCWSRSRSC